MYNNFCRPHMPLTKPNCGITRTPAKAVGVSDHVRKLEGVVAPVGIGTWRGVRLPGGISFKLYQCRKGRAGYGNGREREPPPVPVTQASPQGTGFFLMSTLLPMMPPRMPPAAAPMMPPFTLSRLVVAPMIAPAAAPIAASRLVFFSVTVRGSEATTLPPLLPLPPDDEAVERWRTVEVWAGAALLRIATGAGAAAAAARVRSAAEIESSVAV